MTTLTAGQRLDGLERTEQEHRTGQDPTDASLVRRAADGDSSAWNLLVARHAGRMWAVARSFRLGDADAADVVQTAWLRLTENLDRLHDGDAVGAWLVTTARRECLRLVRERAHATSDVGATDDVAAEVADDAPTPDRLVVQADQAARLRAAFHRLPADDQQLLGLLSASPRPSYREVAATLSMPIGSIGPTRARALGRLRQELLAEGVTDAGV